MAEFSVGFVVAFIFLMIVLITAILIIYRIAGLKDLRSTLLGTISVLTVILIGGIFVLPDESIKGDLLSIVAFLSGSLVGALSSSWHDK